MKKFAATMLRVIVILGGVFLLLVPLIPGLRNTRRPSNNVIGFLTGLLAETWVALSFYVDALRIAQDPEYLRMFQLKTLVAGIAIGLLAGMAVRDLCAHHFKNPNA
jgi:hypothetical protein